LTPILFSQSRIPDGIYNSQIFTLGNEVYEFHGDTFLYRFGDTYSYDCHAQCSAIKGTYKISRGRIYFTPFTLSNLLKSEIRYSKKDTFPVRRFNFNFSIRDLKSDSFLTNSSIQLFETGNKFAPFLTLFPTDGKISFSYEGIENIEKLLVDANCFESIQLDFDSLFFGTHEYAVNLAEKEENYETREPYSLELIKMTDKYLVVKGSHSFILLKKEYVTSEFLKTGIYKEPTKTMSNQR
jgi:hypothetical protein